jgi:membrane protein YdbS with pleckstrin-like domain
MRIARSKGREGIRHSRFGWRSLSLSGKECHQASAEKGRPSVEANDSPGEKVMTPLHPNQVWVLRIRAGIAAVIALLVVTLFDLGVLRETALPAGAVPGFVALLALLAVIVLPPRRYRAWGYREEVDELHVRHGLFTRVRSVVPFGRVQHIDIAHGPVERRFGLATLILHTAGTRGAAVPLPGLLHEEAERMRDRIRAKIRQDLV